ncbi:MAG: hypothetical protein VW891_07965 [Novosphingobium sp.]
MAAAELSFDAGLVQYAVSDHLAKIVNSVFAMGPAWGLMRAVSSYLDPEAIERDLMHVSAAKRAEFEARLRQAREKSSELILRLLDLWLADPGFESELHDAIFAVAQKYDGLERKAAKPRSPQAMRKSVPAEGKSNVAEVLAGLSPAKP